MDSFRIQLCSKRSTSAIFRNAPRPSCVLKCDGFQHMALDNERSQIAHLLRRAGFGATEGELEQYQSLGFDGAVERLLNPTQVDDSATDQQLASLASELGDPKKIEPAGF